MKKIALAFISVFDKTGVVEIASFLAKKGVEIVCTTATGKMLEKNGIKTKELSAITGQEHVADGEIEGLYPYVFNGIMSAHTPHENSKTPATRPIDLVIINPVPFGQTKDDIILPTEKVDPYSVLDVAGISLIRTAAKNFKDVAVLVNPSQYAEFMEEFAKGSGSINPDYARKLGVKAFELTTSYDIGIYRHMYNESNKESFLPETLFLTYKKSMDLRHGENPHQRASFYKEPDLYGVSIGEAMLHKGPPMTYNLMYDLNLALEIVMEFDKPAVAVVKQGVPLGVALDKDPCKAYMRARDVEPNNTMGAVVAFNGQIEKRAAKELSAAMNEAVIALRYTDGALEHLKNSAKKNQNVRILQITSKKWTKQAGTLNLRSMLGGVLVQENDDLLLPEGAHLKVMSKRKPTRKQLADLILAWKVCKHVGSSSVVLAKDLQTIGTAANQINRAEAMKIAFDKAGENSVGSVVAFDSFIPFRNVIDEASRYGITSIIQPGGAIRDDEITMACDEHNIALAMTGMRHYKHG